MPELPKLKPPPVRLTSPPKQSIAGIASWWCVPGTGRDSAFKEAGSIACTGREPTPPWMTLCTVLGVCLL
jgi:hypothetical protein